MRCVVTQPCVHMGTPGSDGPELYHPSGMLRLPSDDEGPDWMLATPPPRRRAACVLGASSTSSSPAALPLPSPDVPVAVRQRLMCEVH